MTIEFTDELKTQIILNAVTSSGAGATDQQIVEQVKRTVTLLTEGSLALRAFETYEYRASKVESTKTFPGSVLYVDLEESSNRPIVFFKTKPDSEYCPDGVEHVRLDRTDSAEGGQSKALARLAQDLIGHKVLISVSIEKAGKTKVRILKAIEDRGVDPDLAGYTLETSHALINWNTEARAKLAPKLVRLRKYRA